MSLVYMRGERLEERGPVPAALGGHWLVIWDGECGFCRRSVEWVLRRDRKGALRAAAYQECEAWLPEPVWRLSRTQAHLRSPEGRYWGGGAAAIRLAGLLGHPWLERLLGLPPLRLLTELGYRTVAGNRRWLGRWSAR
jgi:predicted DCC family thiol-disulfide oxidoreductase YuxK